MALENDSTRNEASKENNDIGTPATPSSFSQKLYRKQRLAAVFQELTNHNESQAKLLPTSFHATRHSPPLRQTPSCLTQASGNTFEETTAKQGTNNVLRVVANQQTKKGTSLSKINILSSSSFDSKQRN